MKISPIHPGLRFWQVCAAAVALLMGLALAIPYPKELPKTSPVPTLPSAASPKAVGHDGLPDAPMPVDLYRFALNALLVPLLDDAQPRRWTDLAINFSCDPGTNVMVDGEPMVVGKLIPSTAFTLRWKMNRCAPLGRESVELSGSVELLVSHKEFGLRAVVLPDGLRVDSHMGRAWLHGPFVAETSLATQIDKQSSKVALQ